MGSALSCEKCEAASASTIFSFSEPLVLKITEGVIPEAEVFEEGVPTDMNDREWMEKIMCIDESHTHAYMLSKESFDRLVNSIEKRVLERCKRDPDLQKVVECYRKHPGQTLECSEDVKKYIDKVDLQILRILKQKFSRL